MKIRKIKKGDISSQQLVLLIILIASFAVILFFLVRLNLGKTTAKEVCHNSIVSKSAPGVLKEASQFNCKTNYVCITDDGTCEAMSGTREVKKAKTKEEVYDVLAEEMADCWWMFGEGKINYVGEEFFPELYCSICSQVAFDNSLEKIFPEKTISKENFYTYLSLKKTSKNISYLTYLTGAPDINSFLSNLQLNNTQFRNINIDKQFYVVMGISSKVNNLAWIGVGVGLGIIVLATGGTIIPVLIVAGAGGVGGYFIGTIVQGQTGNSYLSPTIVEANSEDFNSLNCKDIKTIA